MATHSKPSYFFHNIFTHFFFKTSFWCVSSFQLTKKTNCNSSPSITGETLRLITLLFSSPAGEASMCASVPGDLPGGLYPLHGSSGSPGRFLRARSASPRAPTVRGRGAAQWLWCLRLVHFVLPEHGINQHRVELTARCRIDSGFLQNWFSSDIIERIFQPKFSFTT